ncbi:hypothetical protein KBC04_03670 [Candidatus Babeliales bacterium]|nr:hypothetical protein [Candidatus Babeliales bacterium]MBP9843849.1 hypothetical protein [Candidatus Babeliales bacterium]
MRIQFRSCFLLSLLVSSTIFGSNSQVHTLETDFKKMQELKNKPVQLGELPQISNIMQRATKFIEAAEVYEKDLREENQAVTESIQKYSQDLENFKNNQELAARADLGTVNLDQMLLAWLENPSLVPAMYHLYFSDIFSSQEKLRTLKMLSSSEQSKYFHGWYKNLVNPYNQEVISLDQMEPYLEQQIIKQKVQLAQMIAVARSNYLTEYWSCFKHQAEQGVQDGTQYLQVLKLKQSSLLTNKYFYKQIYDNMAQREKVLLDAVVTTQSFVRQIQAQKALSQLRLDAQKEKIGKILQSKYAIFSKEQELIRKNKALLVAQEQAFQYLQQRAAEAQISVEKQEEQEKKQAQLAAEKLRKDAKAEELKQAQALKKAQKLEQAQALKKAEKLTYIQALKEAEKLEQAQALREAEKEENLRKIKDKKRADKLAAQQRRIEEKNKRKNKVALEVDEALIVTEDKLSGVLKEKQTNAADKEEVLELVNQSAVSVAIEIPDSLQQIQESCSQDIQDAFDDELPASLNQLLGDIREFAASSEKKEALEEILSCPSIMSYSEFLIKMEALKVQRTKLEKILKKHEKKIEVQAWHLAQFDTDKGYKQVKEILTFYAEQVCNDVFDRDQYLNLNYLAQRIVECQQMLARDGLRISYFLSFYPEIDKKIQDRLQQLQQTVYNDKDEYQKTIELRSYLAKSLERIKSRIDVFKKTFTENMKLVKDNLQDETKKAQYKEVAAQALKFQRAEESRLEDLQQQISRCDTVFEKLGQKVELYQFIQNFKGPGGLLDTKNIHLIIDLEESQLGQDLLDSSFDRLIVRVDSVLDKIRESGQQITFSLEIQHIIQAELLDILGKIGLSDDACRQLSKEFLSNGFNFAQQYYSQKLDLDIFTSQLFWQFNEYNQNHGSNYTQAQLKDVVKIYIKVIQLLSRR